MPTAELVIVAGKGGVGRSTIAAALAANSAALGKRVLAVDAVGSGGLENTIANAGLLPASAAADQSWPGHLEVLRLTTRESLDQYLKIYLKLPLGPSRLGPLAKIFDYVSAAAPGVRELLTIGKIGWEARNGDWDQIIVDAPATGHVVELLTAPQSMAELIPTGPLAQQTGWLTDVLTAETTSVVLVTIPEELPVTETGELLDRLRSESGTAVSLLVVNKAPVEIGPGGLAEAAAIIEAAAATGSTEDDAIAGAVDLACARHRLAQVERDRLLQYGLPTLTIADHPAAPVDAARAALADSDSEPESDFESGSDAESESESGRS